MSISARLTLSTIGGFDFANLRASFANLSKYIDAAMREPSPLPASARCANAAVRHRLARRRKADPGLDERHVEADFAPLADAHQGPANKDHIGTHQYWDAAEESRFDLISPDFTLGEDMLDHCSTGRGTK